MFLTSPFKITSGEIIVKEGQGRAQAKQSSGIDKEISKADSTSKTTSITSKVFFKNQNQKKRIIQFRPSMYQSSPHPPPHHTHPEERIWAGRTPRRQPWVPDAPKIKHDKMKQFYMIDMERKRW